MSHMLKWKKRKKEKIKLHSKFINNHHKTWKMYTYDNQWKWRIIKLQTVASYARQFSILDKSTWHWTERIILAREFILYISFSRSSKGASEFSEETRSTLLRITTSYNKQKKVSTWSLYYLDWPTTRRNSRELDQERQVIYGNNHN